ncbi:uncharacterized protein LOC129226628 [Uloborus diversus]|uniref:uncharacterized protein LOC129226628 n=1 Tax=Uloborus diversus TaxID=327109 RepID=UPI00240A67BE|nr:uncharacterized protein LOC129226628 [Uloborus diversus]
MWPKVHKHLITITSLGLPLLLLTIAVTSLPTAKGLSHSGIPQNITCKSNTDCQAINGSICQDSICACPEDKPAFVNVTINATVSEGYCLDSWNTTGANCSFSEQCDYDHGLCANDVCACERRFTSSDEGVCQPVKKSDLIPIAVGAALAAIVLLTLGAYFWMSRKKK